MQLPRAGAVSLTVGRESPADLSTSAISSGSRPALTQPMDQFAYRRAERFDGAMQIIEHREPFDPI